MHHLKSDLPVYQSIFLNVIPFSITVSLFNRSSLANIKTNIGKDSFKTLKVSFPNTISFTGYLIKTLKMKLGLHGNHSNYNLIT